jgi:protein-disulfide isomerase
MASRAVQREQARAVRIAAEQAGGAQAARLIRIRMVAGVVLIAMAVVAVGIAMSSRGAHSGLQRGSTEAATYRNVAAELHGIPQNGTTLGNPDAKVTLTYFADLQCPVCAAFSTDPSLLPQFIRTDVKTGVAKVTYRSLCTATCNDAGPNAFNTQQTAAYAAGEQKLFWEYAELFYHEQGLEGSGYATKSFFNAIAAQIPALDLGTWRSDARDPALLAQVQSDQVAASADGFSATPSLVMSGPKGNESLGSGLPASFSVLANAVKTVS